MKRLFSRKNFINYSLGQKIVNKLGYPDFYTPRTTVLDAYSGAAVFSAAIHNEIKPLSHILMEPYPSYSPLLTYLADPPRVITEIEDPFRWSTFQHLVDQNKFHPTKHDRSKIHNELLFTANLLHSQGEQLVTQYINCISNQSWILKNGRVRLLLWMRSSTAEKLLAGPGESHRHRLACQREACCDARVVLHTLPKKKAVSAKYPAVLLDPMVSELNISKDFVGTGIPDVSLIELTPHKHQVKHQDEFEYVIKMLFVLNSTPLRQSLNSLGPGALEDLNPQLEDILHLKPIELNREQLQRITEVFWRWPFKPELLMDFYEEKGMGLGSDENQ